MLYNGYSFSFADVQLAGFPGDMSLFTAGLREINADDEASIVKPTGAGAIALPTGAPFDYKVSASLTIMTDVWEQVLSQMPDAYAEEKFNLILTCKKKGGGALMRRELIEAQIRKVGDKFGRSAEGFVTSLELEVRYLLRNGKCLVRRQ